MSQSPLMTAILEIQKNPPTIVKDKSNPAFRGSKYASLDTVLENVRAALNQHGVVLIQHPSHADGEPALRTKLVHAESGESEESEMLLLVDKQNAQGQGSAITYARRYAALSALGLTADEDDDGNTASRQREPVSQRNPLDPNVKRNLQGAYLGLKSLVGQPEADRWVAEMLATDFSAKSWDDLDKEQGEKALVKLEMHRVSMAEGVPS